MWASFLAHTVSPPLRFDSPCVVRCPHVNHLVIYSLDMTVSSCTTSLYISNYPIVIVRPRRVSHTLRASTWGSCPGTRARATLSIFLVYALYIILVFWRFRYKICEVLTKLSSADDCFVLTVYSQNLPPFILYQNDVSCLGLSDRHTRIQPRSRWHRARLRLET